MEGIVIFIVLELAAFAGLWCHWWKKHYRLQTLSGFYDYLSSNPKHTRRAVSAVFTAVAAFFLSGAEVSITPQWMANAWMAGYSLDSALNKTKEQV